MNGRGEQEKRRTVENSRKGEVACGLLLTCSSALGIEPMALMFENLDVYKKAVDLTDCIFELTESFPRGYGFLADQLNRAVLSIAANLAEGNGRFTKADRKNFFIIARGSVQECVPLLEVAYRRKLLGKDRQTALRAELEVIAKMISGPLNGLDKRNSV